MKMFFEALSNRELSVLIWLGIFLSLMIIIKSLRDPLWGIVKVLSSRKILIPLGLLSSYVIFLVVIFYKAHLWNATLLKDTIFWFFSIALIQFFKSNEINSSDYFWKIIEHCIKLTILLEFVLNFYTFSLTAELIIFQILAIIGATQAYADAYSKKERKYKEVSRVLKNLLGMVGVVFFFFVLYKTIVDYKELFTVENFKALLLPPVLTILVLPFTYLIVTYMIYETIFIDIRFMSNDEVFKKNLKKSILKIAKLNINKLSKISRNLSKSDLYHADNTQIYLQNIANSN